MSIINRILVPTDFSTTSDLAIGYGIDLAKRYGASMHLLHIVEDTYLCSRLSRMATTPNSRESSRSFARTRNSGWSTCSARWHQRRRSRSRIRSQTAGPLARIVEAGKALGIRT